MKKITLTMIFFICFLSMPVWAVQPIDPVFLVRCPAFLSRGMSGVADNLGPESSYINPSVLAYAPKNNFEAVYGNYYGELQTAALMLTKCGSLMGGDFSFYYGYSHTGPVAITTDHDYDNHPNVMGNLDNGFHGALLSYYRDFNNAFAASVGVKYIKETLGDDSASGYGFNLGFSTHPLVTALGEVVLGMSLYDMGSTRVLWNSGIANDLSQNYRLGVAISNQIDKLRIKFLADRISEGKTTFGAVVGLPQSAIDIVAGINGEEKSFGIEYNYQGLFISAAYVDNKELGGSYTTALGFAIESRKREKPGLIKHHDIMEDFRQEIQEKPNLQPEQKVEPEQETPQKMFDIEDEMRRLKQENEKLFH